MGPKKSKPQKTKTYNNTCLKTGCFFFKVRVIHRSSRSVVKPLVVVSCHQLKCHTVPIKNVFVYRHVYRESFGHELQVLAAELHGPLSALPRRHQLYPQQALLGQDMRWRGEARVTKKEGELVRRRARVSKKEVASC